MIATRRVRMLRSSLMDGASSGLAGFGDGLVLRHMRRHVGGAKIGDRSGETGKCEGRQKGFNTLQ